MRLATLEGDLLALEATTTAATAETTTVSATATATTVSATATATTTATTAETTTTTVSAPATAATTAAVRVTRLGEVQTDGPTIEELPVLGLEGSLRILDGVERDIPEALWLTSCPRKRVRIIKDVMCRSGLQKLTGQLGAAGSGPCKRR